MSLEKTSVGEIAETDWRPCTFLARQPIFDRRQRVFGYELLFRQGLENFFSGSDTEAACRHTIDTSLLMGLDSVCGGTHLFMNCTREVLLKGYIRLFPAESTVVEVLESVVPDSEVRRVCVELREAGYAVALDDFVPDDVRQSLVDVADFIKVDMLATPRSRWKEMVERFGSGGTRLLAEKVETPGDFKIALELGYEYFQGYFFQRPVILSAKEIPASQLNYLRMLQAANQPELDWKVLETMIKQEASLTYRLLRYLNSAAFGLAGEIRSVRHALSMLGEREIRRWISLVATLASAKNKPGELVQSAMIRARFCEVMAQRSGYRNCDCFLVGLLSLMDTILGISMTDLLGRISVHREIKAALLGQENRPRVFLELALAQEAADWSSCNRLALQLRRSEGEVSEVYMESMRWAREIVRVSRPE